MTIKDAAHFINCSKTTVYRYIAAKKFRVSRYSSRLIRIDRGELERFKKQITK